MKSVTADQLEEQLENGQAIQVLDVREDSEVAYGMIPDALHIPLGELPARSGELEKGKAYAIVCKAGGRSAQACAFLEEEGFDVTNVVGGMMDWKGETIA